MYILNLQILSFLFAPTLINFCQYLFKRIKSLPHTPYCFATQWRRHWIFQTIDSFRSKRLNSLQMSIYVVFYAIFWNIFLLLAIYYIISRLRVPRRQGSSRKRIPRGRGSRRKGLIKINQRSCINQYNLPSSVRFCWKHWFSLSRVWKYFQIQNF